MRLWTLHPQYLDAKGLVAAWREALLAQAVLQGKTKGYRSHSQLRRFQAHDDPIGLIAAFLAGLADEAEQRGYRFDSSKIFRRRFAGQLPETKGQLLYEWTHLKLKLQKRAPDRFLEICSVPIPKPHPLFRIIPGEIRDWERP